MGLRTQHSELTEISDRNFEASLESKYALEAHGMDGTGRIENGTVMVHRVPPIQAPPRVHPTHIGGVRRICGRKRDDDLFKIQQKRDDDDNLFKIQQKREMMTYSKSSKRERGLIQNPARERERGVIQNPAREREGE